MAINLLSYLRDQFSSTVVDQLSTQLHETPAHTLKALTGVLPAVLGGLAHHVSSDAGSLISFLRQGNYDRTPIDVAQVTDTQREMQEAVASGNQFVNQFMGSHTSEVTTQIARFSGAKNESVQALIGLVGSELMGVFGRQTLENGLTSENFHTLMAGQADTIRAAIPAGLSGLVGTLGLDHLKLPANKADIQPVDNLSGSSLNPNIPKSPAIDRRRENNRWLSLAGLLMGVLVLGLLVQKCREPQNGSDGVMTDTTARIESDAQEDTSAATRANVNKSNGSNADTTTGALGMAVGSPESASTGAGANKPDVRMQVELPGGRRLKLTENSFTYNLARFLASKPKNPERTFTFDNLMFDTNSARITSESQPNVNDLIEIMKAYPSLNIRVEGHTDNTGEPAANKKLSLDRANAVKTALEAAGIQTSRVLTQGFGSEKPTASNDTEAGRHQNRRIDVVVTKL